ncbi:CRIB domain-containing protein [Stylosanthes scabra]|uniref:CRIB domain-containing protein n=1 Tax=Stylosanthes scabra TaxID=79078 RepID=A0ABU6QRL9_9FABA|nr:CRIB domain-containing protein [Stylosanthes scabra]
MRQRMERLVILPFSAGCISEASVAVGLPQPTRRSKPLPNTSIDPTIKGLSNKGSEDSSDASTGENLKNPMRLLENVHKPNISTGFNRLVKGFKNISQLFVEKDDEEDDEDFEELDMEMEIGCPTDVQHVTHIGLDGITTPPPTNAQPPSSSSSSSSSIESIKGWDHLITHELLTLSAHQSLQRRFHEVPNLDSKLEPPSCSPMKSSSSSNN